ncbi:MAG: GNAT family N-acetyltransferase [Bacteroidota bacterium]
MKGPKPDKLEMKLVSGRNIDPARWDHFVHEAPTGSVFALHGYASAEKDWQACIVEDTSGWRAVMPIIARKKGGFSYVTHPPFCQFWGPILAPPISSHPYTRLSEMKKVISLLAAHLASYTKVTTYCSPALTYPLPFHWNHLHLHTRYTFQLDLGVTIDRLKENLAPPLRRQVKKAINAGYELRLGHDASYLLELIEKNRQEGHDIVAGIPDSFERLRWITHYLLEEEKGRVLSLWDGAELLAAGLFAHYKGTTTYLIGSQSPKRGASGAMSALMWEAIRQAKVSGDHTFDFEGSMIEGVEAFFRKFGAQPVPYLQISKNDLPLPIRWISG